MPRFHVGDTAVIESPVYTASKLFPIDPAFPARLLGRTITIEREVDDQGDVVGRLSNGTLVYVLEDGLTFPEHVEPLADRLESTNTHDPYVNRSFIAMMDAPDNADITRAVNVGLAVNDPERPKEEQAPAATATPRAIVGLGTNDTSKKPLEERHILRGVDKDGDTLHLGYDRAGAHIFARTGPAGFYIRIQDIPKLIVWLKARENEHRGGTGAAS